MKGTVAVIVKGYPRLSETFIAQELAGLERRGLALHIVSLRRPTDPARHPIHQEIAAPLHYLPEYLHDEPLRVARAWRVARSLPGYLSARRAWLADLWRDPTRNRIRRFGQAVVLAHELPRGVKRLHAHFLHTPASVARYASLLTGLPWSCSAHAKDIWTTREWEKREKLAALDWLVTCSRAGAEHLAALAPDARKVELLYHGIDLDCMPPPRTARPLRDGSDPKNPVVILSVGRLVEKKGYADLLAALARLAPQLHWRFVQVGGGPLARKLRRQAARSGMAERIAWLGPRPRDEVLVQYRAADLFALACRTGRNGDRDGLPNVLLEAQSQGLACLSTTAGAVPELIEAGETGLLSPTGDVAALAAALKRLIRSPRLRARLGAAGARRVREAFACEPGLVRLAAKLGLASGDQETAPALADAGAEEPTSCALRSTRR